MLNDLQPIIVDLPCKKDAVIYPIADVHYGSPQFREEEWAKFCDKLLAQDNAYVVLVGDLCDNGLKNSLTNVYEQTCRPRDQKKWVASQLERIKDRILCGVGGNHERRSGKEADEDILGDVFCKLDLEDRYRENAAFLFLRLCQTEDGGEYRGNSDHRPAYTLLVTHGAGGGITLTGGLGRVERFAGGIEGLDLIVTGHTHKPSGIPDARLVIDKHDKKISFRTTDYVVATSWLAYGGYAMQKLYKPTAFVEQKITLSGRGHHVRYSHEHD